MIHNELWELVSVEIILTRCIIDAHSCLGTEMSRYAQWCLKVMNHACETEAAQSLSFSRLALNWSRCKNMEARSFDCAQSLITSERT